MSRPGSDNSQAADSTCEAENVNSDCLKLAFLSRAIDVICGKALFTRKPVFAGQQGHTCLQAW